MLVNTVLYTLEENAYLNGAATIAGCTGGGVSYSYRTASDGIEFFFQQAI
jgi:hypothetical protein